MVFCRDRLSAPAAHSAVHTDAAVLICLILLTFELLAQGSKAALHGVSVTDRDKGDRSRYD